MEEKEKIKDVKTLLCDNIDKFVRAYDIYKKTFSKVQKIQWESVYQDLDEYELLSSRFQRLIDHFISKLARTIFIFESWSDEWTSRDMLLFCEKLKIISSVDLWMKMKSIRNQIVHEYLVQELQELYELLSDDFFEDIDFTYKQILKYKNKII